MSKGKALVAATVVAVAVVGWRFIESVLAEAEEELDREPFRPEPDKAPTPSPTPRAKPTKAAGTAARQGAAIPAGATKAELYEIATKLKIKGRSKMSKAELAKAIKNAS